MVAAVDTPPPTYTPPPQPKPAPVPVAPSSVTPTPTPQQLKAVSDSLPVTQQVPDSNVMPTGNTATTITSSPTLTAAQQKAADSLAAYQSSLSDYNSKVKPLQEKLTADQAKLDALSAAQAQTLAAQTAHNNAFRAKGTTAQSLPVDVSNAIAGLGINDVSLLVQQDQVAINALTKPSAPVDALGNPITDISIPFAVSVTNEPVGYTQDTTKGSLGWAFPTGVSVKELVTYSDLTTKELPRQPTPKEQIDIQNFLSETPAQRVYGLNSSNQILNNFLLSNGITIDLKDQGINKSGSLSERALYVNTIFTEAGQGYAAGNPNLPLMARVGNLLGIVGLAYNAQTKTVTDPLSERIAAEDFTNTLAGGHPGGYAGISGSGSSSLGSLGIITPSSSVSPKGNPQEAYGGLAQFLPDPKYASLVGTKDYLGNTNSTGSLDVATKGQTKSFAANLENSLSNIIPNTSPSTEAPVISLGKAQALLGKDLSNFGQNALGYKPAINPDGSYNYSPEQIISITGAIKSNPEYAANQNFLVSNIGTENSTGSTAALNLTQQRNTDNPGTLTALTSIRSKPADISSLSSVPLVGIGGGHFILESLLYAPSKEDIISANLAIDKENLLIAQENQLIEQFNLNEKINAGIDKLAAETSLANIITSAKQSGAKTIDVFLNTPNTGSVFPVHNSLESLPLTIGALGIESTSTTLLESIPISKANTELPAILSKFNGKDISLGWTGINSVNSTGAGLETDLSGIVAIDKNTGLAVSNLPSNVFAKEFKSGQAVNAPNYLNELQIDIEKYETSNNPLVRTAAVFAAPIQGLLASTLNLAKQGGAAFTSLFETNTPAPELFNVQESASTGLTSGLFSGIVKAAQTHNVYSYVDEVMQGVKQSGATVSKLGILGVGQAVEELFLYGLVPSRIIPVKVGAEASIVFEGIGKVKSAAPAGEAFIQGEKLITTKGLFTLGYNGKNAVMIGGVTSEGERLPFISTLKPEDLPLQNFRAFSERGAEAGYVTKLTVSKLYTPAGTDALVAAGKITAAQQNDLIVPASDVMKAILKIPDVTITQPELEAALISRGFTDSPEVAAKISGVISTVQNPGKTALAYAIALKSGNAELAAAYKPFLNPLNSFPAGKGSVINIIQLAKYNQDLATSDLFTNAGLSRLSSPAVPDRDLVPTRPISSMGDLLDVDLKSEKQSNQLLNLLNVSGIASEGKGFGSSGLNITYGEAVDVFSLGKVSLKENEALHGTAESGAEFLTSKGAVLSPDKKFFITKDLALAEHYGLRELERTGQAPRFVKVALEPNAVLNFKDLSEIDKAFLTTEAKAISKERNVDPWQALQESFQNMAEAKGLTAYEKPYDVSNPLNLNAKSSEIVIFKPGTSKDVLENFDIYSIFPGLEEKSALKGITEVLEPTVKKEVTNGDELLNLLGKKDEINTGASKYTKGTAFNVAEPKDVISQGGLKVKTIAFQGWAKLKSLTSYQTLETLSNFKNAATPEIFEKALERFQGMEMIIRPPLIRDKDVIDAYSILRYGEKTVGGKHGQIMGDYARSLEKHFTDIDFSVAKSEVDKGILVPIVPRSQVLKGVKPDFSDFMNIGQKAELVLESPGSVKHENPLEESKAGSAASVLTVDNNDLSSLRSASRPSRKSSSRGSARHGSSLTLSIKSESVKGLSPGASPSISSPASESLSSLFNESPGSLSTHGSESVKSLTQPSPRVPESPSLKVPSVKTASAKTESLSGLVSGEAPALIVPHKENTTFTLDMKTLTTEGIKPKPKPRADFLGNSSEIQVVGLYNRSETVYGQKRISKLTTKDYSRMKNLVLKNDHSDKVSSLTGSNKTKTTKSKPKVPKL